MSWGCLWDTQQSVWHWQAPPSSPWISHRFIKGKFHLTAGCHFTIHKRQWNHFPENILQPKFHQTKQKNPPLMRQKPWGNNTEGWSDLQEVLLIFLSPKLKQCSIMYLMKWHKFLLCFVTWKQHTHQVIRCRPRKICLKACNWCYLHYGLSFKKVPFNSVRLLLSHLKACMPACMCMPKYLNLLTNPNFQ